MLCVLLELKSPLKYSSAEKQMTVRRMSFVQTISFESVALPLNSQSSNSRLHSRNVLTPRRTVAANLHSNSWRSSASSPSSSQLSVSSFTNSSSTSVLSMRRSDAPPSGSLLGRPTKASLLRMKSCPTILSAPDYKEMVRKKKEFVKHNKSKSVTAIMENAIPEGESMHAFVTGARYNSAQCVDSKSLAQLGVYVARGSEPRSFVNVAPAQRTVPKRSLTVSKQQAWTSPATQRDHRHQSPVNTISTSTSSIDRELARIFGPDDDYSDSSLAGSQLFNGSVFLQQTSESKGILKMPKRPLSCDDRLLQSSPLKPKLSLVSFSSKVKVNEDDVMIEEYAESESVASSAIDEEDEDDEDRLNMVSPIAQQLAKDILEEALDADSISSDDTINNDSSTVTNTKQSESDKQGLNVFMTDPQSSPLHSKAMINFKDNIT